MVLKSTNSRARSYEILNYDVICRILSLVDSVNQGLYNIVYIDPFDPIGDLLFEQCDKINPHTFYYVYTVHI